MAERIHFALRPTGGARPLDAETARRIGQIAGAELVEMGEGGIAHLAVDAAQDPVTARGNLQMAARIELGAHWQTRYELLDASS